MTKWIEDHLVDRHMNVDLYDGVFIGDDVATFMLWNLSGMAVGFQQYRPFGDKKIKNHRSGRYFNYVTGHGSEKLLAAWGMESLSFRDDILIIVEGIFDAVRMHNLGIPCIALLNSSSKRHKSWLNSLGRVIYKIEDDHASQLGPYPNIYIPTGREDLGDCSTEEVKEMITTLTTRGNNHVCVKK